jgi:hypothetical protein
VILVGGLAAVLGIGIASRAGQSAFLVVAPIVGAFAFVRWAWRRPPRAMITRELVVDAGAIDVDGVAVFPAGEIKTCTYDPVRGLLWLRGKLAWPLLCVDPVSHSEAAEIADALGVPESGLRTHICPSPIATIPWIGWLVTLVAGCLSAFALVMLVAGPWRIAWPALLVVLPLAVAVFTPSRLRIGKTEIVRSWIRRREVISLAQIEEASVSDESLVLRLREGQVRRWVLRFSQGTAARYEVLREGVHAENECILELVRAGAARSLASTFE